MKTYQSISAVLSLFLLLPLTLFSQPVPIGVPINGTGTREYNPNLTANGRTLFYESALDEFDKAVLKSSTLKSGMWNKPEEFKSGATNTITTISNSGFFLNSNGNILLFNSNIHGGVGGHDIWIMEKNAAGAWGAPVNPGAPINSTMPETEPSISPDGKYLYFTRLSTEKTPSGNLCGKIYVSENMGKDRWKAPVLLPSPINKTCECGGRMLSDNKTFLFASMRTGGLGGYDIYKTVQKSDGSWTEPVPYTFMNTAKDDKYVSVPASGDMAYYTGLDKVGGLDIARYKIPEELRHEKLTLVQGNVKNSSTNIAVLPKVVVTNTATNKSTIFLGAADGSFTASVPQDGIYDVAIMAYDGGYSFKSMLFTAPAIPKFEEKFFDVKLSPNKPGLIYPLNNIAFINNSDTLENYSSAEIMRLFIMLKANPTMKIEVGVHTSAVQTDSVFRSGLTAMFVDTLKSTDSTGLETITLKTTYHSNNTVAQARKTANTLIQKGLPADRIIPKGYDDTQPLNPPPGDAILNRRVELKIIQ
jgi:hypothetical protein